MLKVLMLQLFFLPATGLHRDPVIHPEAFPAVGNQPGVKEIPQMPGGLGLSNAQNLYNIADAKLFLPHKEPENCQPGFVRQ